MKMGSVVKWKSQAGGIWKTKRGVISEVVEAGTMPESFEPRGRSGITRKGVSYVVSVPAKQANKFNKYWPLTSALTHEPGTWINTTLLTREAAASCQLDGDTQCAPEVPNQMPVTALLEVPSVITVVPTTN